MKEIREASERQKMFATQIADVLNLNLPENDTAKDYWEFVNNYIGLFNFKMNLTNNIPKMKEKAIKEIERLQNKMGVYFLWHNENLIYIGKSINLSERIVSSIKERNLKIKVTHFSYYLAETQADVHILEPYLITKYKPLLNSEFISTDYTTLFYIDFDINKFERFEV